MKKKDVTKKKRKKEKGTKNIAQAVKEVNPKVIEKVVFNRKKRKRIEKPEQRRNKEVLRRQRKKRKKKDDKELDGEGDGEERGIAKVKGKEKDARNFLKGQGRSVVRDPNQIPLYQTKGLDPKASDW
ncbi:hypothetical protein ElyMa_004863000 [Elysia marginata]|uniref:Uncharacterized protein n=1 Tax=Elysia marginata TaxID=1093978 RepID=A0AAV4IRP2_9GAST|nr:hypothetical protein ElyMa_004863000 [Elysia marginata]